MGINWKNVVVGVFCMAMGVGGIIYAGVYTWENYPLPVYASSCRGGVCVIARIK